MITDVTGIRLTPGNSGRDCLGNGEYYDEHGNPIECCCDQCDYMICCFVMEGLSDCFCCKDQLCPRNSSKSATSPF